MRQTFPPTARDIAPPSRQGGLQRRFALIAGGLLVLTSTLFLVMVTNGYRNRILDVHERASVSVNLLLQAALENAMIKRDLDGLQDIVTRLGAQEGIDGVRIVNPQGEIRFSSYPEQLYQSFDDPAFSEALASRTQRTAFRTLPSGHEVLRSINPVHNRDACFECHGPVAEKPVNGLLVVDYVSTSARREARNGALVLGLLGIAVLLTIEVGLWIALRRFVLDRLEGLDIATRRLASGELQVRAETRQAGRDDEITRLGESFNDMASQLERSMAELKASESFLQALIDAVPDGVRVIDGDFTILMANRAYCEQVGAPLDQVIGARCHASSHCRDAPCVPTLVRCPVAEILNGNRTQMKCNHTHVTCDGAKLPVEVFSAPVTLTVKGREVPCVVESVRDLQAQLNVSQEQRLAEMGILAAGVAHEVNNPLSSIGLALRAIRNEPGVTDKVRRYLSIAETEIANCKRFSDSLLRLAAPPQGATELVDLTRVVEDTLSLLEFEAKQKNVALRSDISGTPRVRATDSDMRILVFNLVLNAIHAMPGGGRAQVALSVQGPLVRLAVSDTGVGIAEADKDKILLPFWTKRADGTRGRGLGLSICSTIVERLEGRLDFDSEPGVDTTFRVQLPNADEAPE